MRRKYKAARRKATETAIEPILGPSSVGNNPEAFLDEYGDDEDCRCSSLFIDPNNPVFVFQPITSGIGFGEQTAFTPAFDLSVDIPPCTSTLTMPGTPPGAVVPGPFHSKAVAASIGFGLVGRLFWARVHCTLERALARPRTSLGCENSSSDGAEHSGASRRLLGRATLMRATTVLGLDQ